MSGAVIVWLAAASAVLGQTTPPAERGNEPFAVGALRTELVGEDKVGRRRAGLICASAGALRWREVEPAGVRAAAAAARAIRDAGVAIDAPDADDWIEPRAPSTGYRLVGAVVGLNATVCAPTYSIDRALDHGRRLKGEGRMRVEWRIYRLADHRVIARAETCAPFHFDRDGMAPSDAGQVGFIENARQVGTALAASPRTFSLPESLSAPGEHCPPRVAEHRVPYGSAELP